MAQAQVIEMNKSNIQEIIEKNPIVFIDFWASWCGPCLRFAPTYEAVAQKNKEIVFAKVNTEVEQEIAAQFEIRSIPTLVIFKNQEIIFYQGGALPEEVLQDIVKKAKDFDIEAAKRESE